MVAIQFPDLLSSADHYENKVFTLLRELISYPTVAYREPAAIAECANYLEAALQTYGYDSTQYPVPNGSPVVYAEKNVGASKTLMFYHHYDVQPEDPIDHWVSPPWQFTKREGRIYGRGAVDNKGHIAISLIAIQMLEDQMKLPVNIKFIIEGEEEAGSNNLPHFTKAHPSLLKADGCIWEGAGFYPEGEGKTLTIPTPIEIWCGLKGNAYFDLKAGGPPKFPRTDVHSGSAAAVPNAAWRLVWALNTLKDEQENILLDGFNELVQPPLKEDIEALNNYKGDLSSFLKKNYNLDQLLLNRSDQDLYVPLFLEPSFSICGMKSGYQAAGSKTIVPAEATVKLDFRLVPDLTVNKVEKLLKIHLKNHGFDDLEVNFITGYNPAKTSVNHPFIQTIRKATQEIVSPTPVNVIPFAPGSGPAYLFTPYTPLAIVTNNVEGLNGHAPNENIPINAIKPSLAYNAFITQLIAE